MSQGRVHCVPIDVTECGVGECPFPVQFIGDGFLEHMVGNCILWIACDLDASNDSPDAFTVDVIGYDWW
jgi:hypothetical protein